MTEMVSASVPSMPLVYLENSIDFDRDDLKNKADTVAANGTNPDVADSDGDTWLDGHELNNGGNPSNPSVISNDTRPPRVLRAVTQFVTPGPAVTTATPGLKVMRE